MNYHFFSTFQFERDKKSKGNETGHIAHTIGLEEVLSSLSSSEFHDDQVRSVVEVEVKTAKKGLFFES